MATPIWIHITAKMAGGAPDLTRDDTGMWLWTRLREAFPRAISCTLMPTHPHLLHASVDPDADRRRMARLLGQLGRHFGVRGQASEVPEPDIIRGGEVLARQVRYIVLNPCRDGLVGCPLAWQWSTHRDVVGAAADPWVSAERLAAALRVSPHGFAQRHHHYVSADGKTDVGGTAFPTAAVPTSAPYFGLGTLAASVGAALRVPASAVRRGGMPRALFIALAFDQGWAHPERLAEVCGCSAKTVRRHAAAVDAAALQAARLCLGDARLRRWTEDQARALARMSSRTG